MEKLLQWLSIGGPVVWVLCSLSVVALMIIIIKLAQFFIVTPLDARGADSAKRAIIAGEMSEAQIALQNQSQPRARVLSALLELGRDNIEVPIDKIHGEAQRIARDELAKLGHYLRVLEVIAMVTPLLGLFGTVIGMIEAFQAMESAGRDVNPGVLSGGIWVALLTTAVGLAVAIPVSLFHSWFERLVETQAQAMASDLDCLLFLQVEGRLSRSIHDQSAPSSSTEFAELQVAAS